MAVWSRVGDQENPTAFRYTYSTKTDETTGNKSFSLKPYLFDSKFLNKLVNLDNSNPMKNAKINGIKVAYTVCSGYGGTWKVQGYFTYTDSNVKKEFTSAISSSFVVNSDYKRIVQTINFDSVDISKIVSPNSQVNFEIRIIKPGDGTLHWHAESGMTTYIDLLVGTSSGAVDSNIITPGEGDEFKRFVDPIEVRLENSSDITRIELDGSGSPLTIDINSQTEWPIEFGTWPYEERVIINGYKANNVLAFTRNINIISEEYFNLNPSVYRMKEIEEDEYQRSFDGTSIELNLDFKISNNSFMEQSNSKNLIIRIYEQSSSNYLYSKNYSVTNTTENFVINIAPIADYTVNADLQDTLIVKIFLDNPNSSNLLFTQDIVISKAVPILNIEENGVTVGMFFDVETPGNRFEVSSDYTSHFHGQIFSPGGIAGITYFSDISSGTNNQTPIGKIGNTTNIYSEIIVNSDIINPPKGKDADWYSLEIKSLTSNAHLINAYGYITYTNDNAEFPLNYYQSPTNFSVGYLDANKNFCIHCQRGTGKPKSYMVILIYSDVTSS